MPWAGPSSPDNRWPMDDANVSGTTITDVVAGALNGTAGSAISSTDGPYTQARNWTNDATNATITLEGCPNDDWGTAFSIGVWLRVADVDDAHGFICNFDTGVNNIRIYREDSSSAFVPGSIHVRTSGGGSGNVRRGTIDAVLTDNTFVHFTVTYGGGSELQIYRNGVSLAITLGSDRSSSVNNAIGNRGNNIDPFFGDMYQFVYYDRELSGTEVLQLYRAEDPPFMAIMGQAIL